MPKLYSNDELRDIIEIEGSLSYTITAYLDPKRIADPRTRELALAAREALRALAKELDVEPS